MGNRSAVYEEAQIALALLDGILPELPDGIEWGENGFPTEAQALEACSPANMSMEAGAGEHTSTPQERIMALHVKMNALLDNVGVVPITEDEDE